MVGVRTSGGLRRRPYAAAWSGQMAAETERLGVLSIHPDVSSSKVRNRPPLHGGLLKTLPWGSFRVSERKRAPGEFLEIYYHFRGFFEALYAVRTTGEPSARP